MKVQRFCFIVGFVVSLVADAFHVAFPSRSSFVGRPSAPLMASDSSFRMDMEADMIDFKTRYKLEKIMQESQLSHMNLNDAEAVHGMPWKSSIDPKVTDDELLYMPFWEWQVSFMKDNLTNLRVLPCSTSKTDFGYNENTDKKARIVNICASSDEYRKIRLTYYDAGDGTQVFNSVWYPDPKYNLPVLGVDVLAFNRKKYLAIVDFQPLHENEEDHASTYEHILKPIKEKYDSLKGRMSAKFYDETQFFSQQMLFSRFDDESIIKRDLFPAFQSYVKTHLDLVRSCNPASDNKDIERVWERQKKYDTYSAERDPATGFFAAMFGNEWAQDFVHDFLFSLSERTEGDASPSPAMGGGRPQVSQQQQQNAPRDVRAPERVAARRR